LLNIAIIVGSTRPGRKADSVAQWFHSIAQKRSETNVDIIDLADHPLPHLDEEVPPSFGTYSNDHTKDWANIIARYDGYVFVTPEYNHSVPGALKNAIDFVYGEWNNKAAGFVSYGSTGGTRAVEHLRQVMAELQVATVRSQVALSIFTDFEDFTRFDPSEVHGDAANALLDQLIAWAGALKTVRSVA
jgi:NAD(P)H-dependent FMN reductase